MMVKESVRYKFTPNEIVDLGDALSREYRKLSEAKLAKSAAAAAHGAEIKAIEQNCTDMADKITLGYEYRDVECEVEFNTPRSGTKRIIRPDTGETVRDLPMSEEERQESLPFDGDGAKRGKK